MRGLGEFPRPDIELRLPRRTRQLVERMHPFGQVVEVLAVAANELQSAGHGSHCSRELGGHAGAARTAAGTRRRDLPGVDGAATPSAT